MTTWLVVGLGNPGPTYSNTRHNVGFMVVDELARRARASWSAPRGMRADVVETRISTAGIGAPGIDAHKVVLVKPRTFMNESGQAVGKLATFHKVAPGQVIAVHDELDLDLGQLRLKLGGGDNGHNGLKSMRRHLTTGDFHRIRFGIGRPPGRQQPADYVLAPIPAALRTDFELETRRAAEAVEKLVLDGLEAAQNRFNN
ncbi:aminoacyl-tRNA hydrolase [Luteococcus sp. H138]|uniref:aminoacyl-tRNA hydrolase n=1 Tax=unclassified Luteococcus TaxID=2639923 RepID=UPI00313E0312